MIPDFYNAEEPDSFGDFTVEFAKQDMISVSDHEDTIEERLFKMDTVDQFASDTGLFPQVPAPLPLRPYRTFARAGDRASPTISGNELRNLEGRPSSEAQMSTLNMPVSSTIAPSYAAPTLRRKGRLGSKPSNAAQYNANQQISTLPSQGETNGGHESIQSPELPMSPSSAEWAQKFREISLHTDRHEVIGPQIQNFGDIQDETLKHVNGQMPPRELFQHRKTFSEQATVGSSYSHQFDYSQQNSHTIPRDVNVPIPIISTQLSQIPDPSPQRVQSSQISNDSFRQHRQTQSWAHAPGLPNDFTVSPSQIHPNWVHGLPDDPSTYFPHMAYPTPTSQEGAGTSIFGPPPEDLHTADPCYPPLHHHTSFPTLQQHTTTQEEVLLANLTNNRRPRTPPPSNPSASPPTPEVTPSPQKQSRAATRRNGNINALRLRKSTAALKPAKSLSALKSPKSAGHLRGKKSVGGNGATTGLNSHNHNHNHTYQSTTTSGSGIGSGSTTTKSPIKKQNSQASGMNFGFMNYTPEDKQKILTGVAPSGSSKTKARRELEANEERRRLILAIEVAGGDSEGVRRGLGVKVEG